MPVSFFLFLLLATATGIDLQTRFQRSFNESCLKYPFIQRYWDSLENPKRHIVFVLHEQGLKNGGLGDRIGNPFSR